MVYCGKPSANCGTCRAKKRRCDKAVPQCGQCVRQGQECPGYRDPLNLLFRNENTRIIDKVRSQRKRTWTDSVDIQAIQRCLDPKHDARSVPSAVFRIMETFGSSSFPSSSSSSPSRSTTSTDRLPTFSLLPTSEELGINYFLSNYTVRSSGPSVGSLSYTVDVLVSDGCGETLTAALQAVGLAGVANTTRQVDLMRQARASYTRTLQTVNHALADHHEAIKDSTLLTIMVLGLFESITCSNQQSVEAWANHINGAIALVVLRGPSQFQTSTGLTIFLEAISHLLISCARIGMPIPPRIRMLRAQAAQFVDTTHPSWAVSGALIELMELFQNIATPDLSDADLDMYVDRAATIDRTLSRRFSSLPPDWRYATVTDPSADPTVAYAGTYHLYYDIWIAKVWNGMRACRIFANTAICRLLQRGARRGSATVLGPQATQTLVRMRDDILASVPQQMGLDASGHGPAAVSASGGYFLYWFLYLAGTMPVTAEETRRWVVDRLCAISGQMGIRKAAYLAGRLEAEYLANRRVGG